MNVPLSLNIVIFSGKNGLRHFILSIGTKYSHATHRVTLFGKYVFSTKVGLF